MSTLLDLYKLRVKVFLGVFKVSKISMALFILYVLSMVPGAFGISFVVADSVRRGADLMVYLETLSATVSGVIAIALLLTWKGFTVFEYEQSFLFTSPILPIQFLVSGLVKSFIARNAEPNWTKTQSIALHAGLLPALLR